MLMLCALASCTKALPLVTNEPVATVAETSELLKKSSKSWQTVYGLGVMYGRANNVQKKMDKANIKLARIPLILSKTTVGQVVDDYLKKGYHVQVNLNWDNTTFGPVPFPANIPLVKQRAEAFFKYYTPYKKQIPLVVVENEWDNTLYHKGTVQGYLKELAAITEVGHKYGFKIADAGLTSTGLRRWMYSQLSGGEAAQWKLNYYVGENNDTYNPLLKAVNDFKAGIKNIPVDYLNVHWYNIESCYNGFEKASKTYKNACGKNIIICNEFGIRTNSEKLFDETVNELKGLTWYAIAFSGSGGKDKAVTLTDNMLDAL